MRRLMVVGSLVLSLLAIQARALERYELHIIGVPENTVVQRHVLVLVWTQSNQGGGSFPSDQRVSINTSSQFFVRLTEAEALRLADNLTEWANGGTNSSIFNKEITAP